MIGMLNVSKQSRSLLALVLGLSALGSAPAYAQFGDMLTEAITGQQENINSIMSDAVSEAVAGSGLTEEQIETLTAQELLQPMQEEEEAEEAAAAAAASRARKLNVDKIMSDYEYNQGMLGAYNFGQNMAASMADMPEPLTNLQSLKQDNVILEGNALPYDIRREAIKEAAISYGARGGLAWRTYEITKEMEKRSRYMDRVFDFRRLLIPAPSGLMIEPPIISESINSMLIEVGGQEAAVSDRIYNIINNARIVSAPRTWRTYLGRTWSKVDPPPDVLRPQNEQERKVWVELVTEGWREGVQQANEIFQEDLNHLLSDFRGMVRYRLLLAQGMISQPYALEVDRGVTGGGSQMRIGDRAVQITGVPQLITGASRWKPASR